MRYCGKFKKGILVCIYVVCKRVAALLIRVRGSANSLIKVLGLGTSLGTSLPLLVYLGVCFFLSVNLIEEMPLSWSKDFERTNI